MLSLMEEVPRESSRPTRSRAVRVVGLVVAAFVALAAGVVLAGAAGGSFRLLPVVAGFLAYVFLFGRALRELDADRLVWDYPDSGLLGRVSGRSPFAGHRP
jgi:hypothetical protein